MSTTPLRLQSALLKLERARTHIDELDACLKAFLESKPFKIGWKKNVESKGIIYYLTAAQDLPPACALITGEVVQCLATALDHLAYQLVCNDTNDAPPNPYGIFFPIAEDEATVRKNMPRWMNGAAQPTIDAVLQLRPYKGGNDALWAVHALNRIEKHRTLLTVAAVSAGVDAVYPILATVREQFGERMARSFQRMQLFVKPAERTPAIVGTEVCADETTEVPSNDFKIYIQIGIFEPGVYEHQRLLVAVNEFANAVEAAIDSCKHRFA